MKVGFLVVSGIRKVLCVLLVLQRNVRLFDMDVEDDEVDDDEFENEELDNVFEEKQ